jgi:TolA-binding protein
MKYKILFLTAFLLLSSAILFAQEFDSTKIGKLEERIKKLEEKIEQDELEKLLEEAEIAANKKEVNKKIKEFSGKDFGYDAMNDDEKNQKAIDEMIKLKNEL